jgi:hypothetical protein
MSLQVYPIAKEPPQTYQQVFANSGTFTVPLGVKTVEVTAISGNDRQVGAGVVKGILDVTNTPTLNIAIGAAGGATTINTSDVVAVPPSGGFDISGNSTVTFQRFGGGGLIKSTTKSLTPVAPYRTRYIQEPRTGTQCMVDLGDASPGNHRIGNLNSTFPTQSPGGLYDYATPQYQNGILMGMTNPYGVGTGSGTIGNDLGIISYGRISQTTNSTAYAPGGRSSTRGYIRFKTDSTGGSNDFLCNGIATSGTIMVGVVADATPNYFTCNHSSNPSTASNWTERTNLPQSISATGVAFGNGTFVIAPQSGQSIFASTDGTSWNTYGFTATPRSIAQVEFAQGLFFLLCGNFYYTSTNGSTWTERTSPATGMADILWNATESKYYAWGSNGMSSSTDGITWTTEFTGVSLGRSACATSPYGILVARGDSLWLWGNYIAYSPVASQEDVYGTTNPQNMWGGAGSPAKLVSNTGGTNYFMPGSGIDGYGEGSSRGRFGGSGNSGGVILKWTI